MRKKKFEEVLEACFGRNDIRCRYGSELNSELIYMIGRASALFFKGKRVIVGRDLRPSSKAMSKILIKGLTDQGVNVIDVGLVRVEDSQRKL
jgi:phosphomannomutase